MLLFDPTRTLVSILFFHNALHIRTNIHILMNYQTHPNPIQLHVFCNHQSRDFTLLSKLSVRNQNIVSYWQWQIFQMSKAIKPILLLFLKQKSPQSRMNTEKNGPVIYYDRPRWWERVDSNHRSQRQQIYSLPPLATREHSHIKLFRSRRPAKLQWSWWTDLNPRPADYKSAALPTELHQRMKSTKRNAKNIRRRPDYPRNTGSLALPAPYKKPHLLFKCLNTIP